MFLRFLISLILAVVSFKVFYSRFPMGFLSFLISILAFYVVWKILKFLFGNNPSKSEKDSLKERLNERQVKLHGEGVEKLKTVKNKIHLIRNNAVAQKVKNICKKGFEIFDYLKQHPEDFKKARQFINYYLDTTEKIVSQYVELSDKQRENKDLQETLEKVESVLDSIEATYEKQLQNLLEDDLLDLNTEIEVLKKTIQMEG